MRKELKALVKQLAAQGFTTRLSSKGHLIVYKDGEWVTTLSGTPSDSRSDKNSLAALKRAGYRP